MARNTITKFDKGQIVKVIGVQDGNEELVGHVGTVIVGTGKNSSYGRSTAVQFPELAGTHSLHDASGASEGDDCYWFDEGKIELFVLEKPKPQPNNGFQVPAERVRVSKDYIGKLDLCGKEGVILFKRRNAAIFDLLVQFSGRDDLHNGDGRSQANDCWWISPDDVKPIRSRNKGQIEVVERKVWTAQDRTPMVGDKVKVKISFDGGRPLIGLTGVVRECSGSDVLVQFKGRNDLHNNDSKSTANDCWWIRVDHLKVVGRKELTLGSEALVATCLNSAIIGKRGKILHINKTATPYKYLMKFEDCRIDGMHRGYVAEVGTNFSKEQDCWWFREGEVVP